MAGKAVLNHEEAIILAWSVLGGTPVSHVDAAKQLSEYVLEWAKNFKQLSDNLTSTQARCTELLEEARALKRSVAASPAPSPRSEAAPGKKDPP